MTQNSAQTKPDTPNRLNRLPHRPENALQHLCKLSASLLDLADREAQALVQNDIVALAVLQDEKDRLTDQYTQASAEFRRRVHEFRNVDRALIQRLEDIQAKLGERTNDNNRLVGKIKERAEQSTHKTLLMAQEYGQSPNANFPKVIHTNLDETASQNDGA